MSKKKQTSEQADTSNATLGGVGLSLFNHIRNRIDRLDEELERVKPFSQAELNLGDRKSKLLKALNTLEREGLL